MIETRHSSIGRDQMSDQVQQPEFRPEQHSAAQSFEDYVAKVATSIDTSGLRPPELQFNDQGRLGTHRFEAQAIVSMDILKANSQSATMDSLSALLVKHSADIHKNGSQSAQNGLRFLDEFLGHSAMVLNMRKGTAAG